MRNNFKKLREPIRANPDRRARVAQFKRAMRDALKLAELREKRRATQGDVADGMSITQSRVSKIEGGGDLYLSTLGNYVAALGGELQIIAVFPEETISLTNPQIT